MPNQVIPYLLATAILSASPTALTEDQAQPLETTEQATTDQEPLPPAPPAETNAVQAPEAAPLDQTSVTPAPAAESATGGEDIESPKSSPPEPRAIVLWSLTGTAGFALLTGSLFGITALAEEQRYEDNPSTQARDRGEARALAADVFFGVGGAAAIAALIVLLTDDDEATPRDADSAADVTMRPSVSSEATGITIHF